MRASIILISSLAIGTLGLLLHLIAIASPNWTSGTAKYGVEFNNGLWKACVAGQCDSIGNSHSSKFDASRAFAILAFFAATTCVVLLGVYMFIKENQLFAKLATLCALITSFCLMVNFGTYCDLFPKNLAWSFGMCVVSFLLFIALTVLLSLHVYNDKRAEYVHSEG